MSTKPKQIVHPATRAPEEVVYCIIVEKRSGGYAIAQGEVQRSAVRIIESRQPDAIDLATNRMVDWVERRWNR